MDRKNTGKMKPKAEGSEIKKRPGRRPMTEKEKAAKLRDAEKKKADNLKPDVIVQYQDGEVDTASLVEAATANFHQTKKRTLVTDLKIYIKPEDHMAYYIINGDHEGKIPF